MSSQYFDAALRGWVVRTAKKEQWRVPSWYSMDDLVQEGYVCYAKCWKKYGAAFDVPEPTKKQRKKFMKLVMVSFKNHITTLSNRATETRSETLMADVAQDNETDTQVFDRQTPAILPDALLLCALAKAPVELLDVIDRVLKDGVDTGHYLRKKIAGGKATVRETTEEYWDRVLGVPDAPRRLAEYLNGTV